MPLEEFQAVSESNSPLRKLDEPLMEIKGNLFLFKECELSPYEDSPLDYLCLIYSDKASSLTVAGFDVSSTSWTPYEAPKFNGKVSFSLAFVTKDALLERLIKRFGEPSDNAWDESDTASWTLGKVGEIEYGLSVKHYDSLGGKANMKLYKKNPAAVERALRAKEQEAQNDF